MSSEIIVEFEIDNAKLISVNDQYMHPVRKTKKGRYVSYYAKSDYLKEIQAFYEEVLAEKIPKEKIKALKESIPNPKTAGLFLEIVIGIPDHEVNGWKSIYELDGSNYIKALEDCITKHTGIDDSQNFKVSVEKRIYNSKYEDGRWAVQVRIRPHKIEKYEQLLFESDQLTFDL